MNIKKILSEAWLNYQGKKYHVLIAEPTPEEALLALERQRHNRPRTDKKLKKLVEAIIGDNYRLNGQTIIFDQDGYLLDGQHRLQACAESKRPIVTFVIQGVPDDVFATLDFFERKFSQILVPEFGLAPKVAVITAAVVYLSYKLRRKVSPAAANNPDIWAALPFYTAERTAIDKKIGEALQRIKVKTMTLSSIVALYHEFSRVDESIGRLFFTEMAFGNPEEGGIFNELHNQFLREVHKRSADRTSPQRRIAMCILAFNALLAGNKTSLNSLWRLTQKGSEFPEIAEKEGIK